MGTENPPIADENRISFSQQADLKVFRLTGCLSLALGLTFVGSIALIHEAAPLGEVQLKAKSFYTVKDNNEVQIIDVNREFEARIKPSRAYDGDENFMSDCEFIVFVSKRDNPRNADIYAYNTSDGSLARLTDDPATDISPNIMQDCEHVVFESNRDGDSEIYRLNLKTREVTNVTNNSETDRLPTISPDGEKIAFLHTEDGTTNVWMWDPRSNVIVQLTHNELAKTGIRWENPQTLVYNVHRPGEGTIPGEVEMTLNL